MTQGDGSVVLFWVFASNSTGGPSPCATVVIAGKQ